MTFEMIPPFRAVNPLGEAICEAELTVGPGEGGAESDLYLPELWKTGKRLTWKDEGDSSNLRHEFLVISDYLIIINSWQDARKKKFVGHKEPELTADDIAEMAKRVSSTPLPKERNTLHLKII